MLPQVDAVASVLRKNVERADNHDDVQIAKSVVRASGLSTQHKGRIVVFVGDDSVGEDEEVVCKGARAAIRLIVGELRDLRDAEW